MSAPAIADNTPTRGLLLVYTERGCEIAPDAFEDWYDNEHIPLRLGLPGPLFLSCTRWTAADAKPPTHLALYDLSSRSAVLEAPYTALAFLDRRVYAPLPTPAGCSPRADYDARAPGPYVSVVELIVRGDDAAGEAELNAWYDTEHVPLLMRVPGWRRTRRFVADRVLSVTGTGVDVRVPGRAPGKYLAIHEWASMDAFGTEEIGRATGTAWRERVMRSGVVVKHERRVFRFSKGWGGE